MEKVGWVGGFARVRVLASMSRHSRGSIKVDKLSNCLSDCQRVIFHGDFKSTLSGVMDACGTRLTAVNTDWQCVTTATAVRVMMRGWVVLMWLDGIS